MNFKMSASMRLSSAALGMVLLLSMQARADEAAMLQGARTLATDVPANLSKVLMDEVAKDGIVSAVGVCKDKAPEMAKAASAKSGWGIRRVSLNNRNPKAVPDAWERAALEDFDRRAAAGEDAATLEKYATVETEGRKEFRYMKALPVKKPCLACHGVVETIKPEVIEKIKALYPDDKATGYSLNQIRGAITLRKAE